MKTFKFRLYIKTAQKQEFLVGKIDIVAKNYDEANKQFNKKDVPFCHFVTVTSA